MLTSLHINNIVLIEKLNLEFGAGLNILTGETGAGKSILLDALSLALGARSDTGLVRHGCEMASVIAEFDDASPAATILLQGNGIEYDGNIILRRTLTIDGKSRAWVNDTPVSVKTLKQIGDALVQIHGQFANHELLDATTHRTTLDIFAALMNIDGFGELYNNTTSAYVALHNAERRMAELQDMLSRMANERDFLAYNVAELQALNPQVGEEDELANQRTAMMNAEKDAAILSDAASAIAPHGQSLDDMICSVAHILEHVKTEPNPYQEKIDKLYAAAEMVADVSEHLSAPDVDITSLDEIEERLFAIRNAARKHRVSADELPAKLNEMAAQLNTLDNSDAELNQVRKTVAECRAKFNKLAAELSNARMVAADELRKRLLVELPDLKLGGVDFMVLRTETAPNPSGIDDITFMIKTNAGTPFAPLHKSASGGELARLMLALRVVLANDTDAPTFVFDEIDTGISGATASAVGARLHRLAASAQALVITHSAQVAGYANRHFKIEKNIINDKTITSVNEITGDARLNEIARIISGAEITNESLDMARTLLVN